MWDKGKVEREEEEEEEEERVKGVQKTRLGLLVCIHEDVVKSLLEINAFNFNFEIIFPFAKKGGRGNKINNTLLCTAPLQYDPKMLFSPAILDCLTNQRHQSKLLTIMRFSVRREVKDVVVVVVVVVVFYLIKRKYILIPIITFTSRIF